VLTAALWGLIQGLTEFLPVSSSGHLVLLPAIFGFEEPSLAASVMLHLGTLVAVVAYYRRDLLRLLHLRSDPEARRILMLLAIGTIPAALIGLTLAGPIETVFSEPWLVAVAMMVTGGVLLFGTLVGRGLRRLPEGRWTDGLVVGLAQAFALLPGISRSGMTMTAGMAQGFSRTEAARFAFLLAIPAIGGAGLIDGIDMAQRGGFSWDLLVGMAVAAVVGYLAIAFLIRVLTRVGLLPFALYCLGAGAAAYFLV
jgi:undecaprenyl-diphosphatase